MSTGSESNAPKRTRGQRADELAAAYLALKKLVLSDYPKENTLIEIVETWGIDSITQAEIDAIVRVERLGF